MRRYIIYGLAICSTVLAIVVASDTRQKLPPPKAFVAHQDGRVRYPAGRYPVLVSPDGQKREVRSLLDIRRPLHFGDYVWNDKDVPLGTVWVRVDLPRQTLSVFRAGQEIGTAIIIFGTDGKPTPSGTFPMLAKAATHRSSLYDASMPFMLRLTGDGVAIHASDVHMGSATHGCIGVPYRFAELLFQQMRRGDEVVILPLNNQYSTPT